MSRTSTNPTTTLISLWSLLFLLIAMAPLLDAAASTSEELREAYPALEVGKQAGNPLILCPFLRMLDRSGRLDGIVNGGVLPNKELKKAAEEFGCDTTTACGPVVDLVSAGQNGPLSLFNPFTSPKVNLEQLWDAPPVSHDCGFTFEKGLGSNGVSAGRLASTLANFDSKKDENGRLVYQDILDVQQQNCKEEGVQVSAPGQTEAQLIFAYLGGVERGYIDYTDVEGFLQVDNQMPLTKAAEEITLFYLQRVK